jgi:hypothetical protein
MRNIDFGQVITAKARAEAAKAVLRERIRQRRNRAMNAGVTFGGMKLHTDESSQQRILSAAVAVMQDQSLVIDWKTASGCFVPLDAEAVLAVAGAVRKHVQACFDREAQLLAAVEADEKADPEEGWPG